MAGHSSREHGARVLGVLAAAVGAGARGLADCERVANYARGRLEFRPRPDDVFISSYPRSGTTWLQMIVHVLLSDGDVQFEHISQVAPWFERNLALGRVRAADFERRPSPRVFKSHLPRRWLPAGARYIYVLRDGRDVAVSYYHFYRSHLGFEGGFDEFFDRFARGRLQYKSWFKHVAGWRRLAHDPSVLIVEYESLSADLRGAMGQIAAFLGCRRSASRIDELAGLCSFEAMKALEAKFDHATEELVHRRLQLGRFIRSGELGAHRDQFSDAQRRAFERLLRRRPARPDLELDIAAFLH